MLRGTHNGTQTSPQARAIVQFPLFLRITCLVLYIFTIIISQKLSFLENPQITLSAGVVDYIIQNLATAPISNILFLDSSHKVPPGYEVSPLYVWPGTKRGCFDDAFSEDSPEPKIIGKISLFSSQCEHIIERQEYKTTYKWGNQVFLVQRNKNFYYKDDDVGCQDHFIECSDTMCVSKDEECPITGLNFLPSPNNEEKEVKLERDQDKSPIYNVEVSIGDVPCYAIGTTPQTPSSYQILNIKHSCGVYGQDKYTEILDSKSQEQYFQENDLSGLYESLPGYYETIKKEKVVLVARKQIYREREAECQVSIVKDNFQYILQYLKNREGILITIRIIETIIFALTFFIKYEEVFRLLEFYCFIELFLALLTIPVSVYAFRLKEIHYYTFLTDLNCLTDPALIKGIIDLQKIIDNEVSSLGVFPLLLILITVLRLVIYRCARKSTVFDSYHNTQTRVAVDMNSHQYNSHMVPLLDGIYPTLINIGVPYRSEEPSVANNRSRATVPASVEMNILQNSPGNTNNVRSHST